MTDNLFPKKIKGRKSQTNKKKETDKEVFK
jgi:hypothetical protein